MNKSKAVQACRGISTEQTQKLQAKFHLEQDLFDDIKNFASKWSAIEKEYSQSLARLANSFKTKREFPVTPIASDDLLSGGDDLQIVTDVWKLTLEKVENLGASHQSLSENITAEVVDTCKSQFKSRAQESKKLFEVLNGMHNDLHQSTRTLAKSKKAYCELEHEAGICRRTYNELQDRLGNKSQRRFFESKAQLEKKFQVLESKLELSEKRSTQARNEYLLSIASCNAINDLFFKQELPTFMESLDGCMYDKVSGCMQSVGRLTSEVAQRTRADFDTVNAQAAKIDRGYNNRCYLLGNPVLTEVVQHAYTPYKEDPISAVSREHDGDVSLTLEARKLTSRVAQCMSMVESKGKEFTGVAHLLETYTKNPEMGSAEARQGAEEQVHELRESIRQVRFIQHKAQARLDVIQKCGINVDEWLQSALQAEKSSGAQRDRLDIGSLQGGSTSPTPRGSMASLDRLDRLARGSNTRSSLDDSFDEFDDMDDDIVASRLQDLEADTVSDFSTYVSNSVRRATVLYDYAAQTDEELSVVMGNEVVILLSSGDGWVKVQTLGGAAGYIPETYIEEDKKMSVTTSRTSFPALEVSESKRSVLGHVGHVETPQMIPEVETAADVADSTLVGDVELSPLPVDACIAAATGPVLMVRSLYSYEATEIEELSFPAGAVIRLIHKDEDDEDGWWEGQLDGKTGVFPSLVVEELSPEESQRLFAMSYPDPEQTPMAERDDPFAVDGYGGAGTDYV